MVCTYDGVWSSRGDPVIDRTVKSSYSARVVCSGLFCRLIIIIKVFVKCKILSIKTILFYMRSKEGERVQLDIWKVKKNCCTSFLAAAIQSYPAATAKQTSTQTQKGEKFTFFSSSFFLFFFLFFYWWEDQAMLSDLFLSICLVFRFFFVKILKTQHDAHLC